MPGRSFNPFNEQGQLKAGALARLATAVHQQQELRVQGGMMSVARNQGGFQASSLETKPFLAIITGRVGPQSAAAGSGSGSGDFPGFAPGTQPAQIYGYTWLEGWEPQAQGFFAPLPGGKHDTNPQGLLYEITGDSTVNVDGSAVVIAQLSSDGTHYLFLWRRQVAWVRVASDTAAAGLYPGFIDSGRFTANPSAFADGPACWVAPPPQLELVTGWYECTAEQIAADGKLIFVAPLPQPGTGCIINEYECVDTRTWAPVPGTVICAKSPKDCCTGSGSGSGSGSGTPEALEINCGLGRIPRLRRVCLCPPLVVGSGSSGSGPAPPISVVCCPNAVPQTLHLTSTFGAQAPSTVPIVYDAATAAWLGTGTYMGLMGICNSIDQQVDWKFRCDAPTGLWLCYMRAHEVGGQPNSIYCQLHPPGGNGLVACDPFHWTYTGSDCPTCVSSGTALGVDITL